MAIHILPYFHVKYDNYNHQITPLQRKQRLKPLETYVQNRIKFHSETQKSGGLNYLDTCFSNMVIVFSICPCVAFSIAVIHFYEFDIFFLFARINVIWRKYTVKLGIFIILHSNYVYRFNCPEM